MTALRELQRDFQACVLGEADAPPATVAGAGTVSAADRMRVYTEAIRMRFLEVLGQDYPGLHALAGDDPFRTLGLEYVGGASLAPPLDPVVRPSSAGVPALDRAVAGSSGAG